MRSLAKILVYTPKQDKHVECLRMGRNIYCINKGFYTLGINFVIEMCSVSINHPNQCLSHSGENNLRNVMRFLPEFTTSSHWKLYGSFKIFLIINGIGRFGSKVSLSMKKVKFSGNCGRNVDCCLFNVSISFVPDIKYCGCHCGWWVGGQLVTIQISYNDTHPFSAKNSIYIRPTSSKKNRARLWIPRNIHDVLAIKRNSVLELWHWPMQVKDPWSINRDANTSQI